MRWIWFLVVAVATAAAVVVLDGQRRVEGSPAPVRVAELDTGVQWDHAWLQNDVLVNQAWTAPWLVRPAGVVGKDDHYIGHGTIVADVLTLSGHAQVIPVKVCSGWGQCADVAGPDVDGVVAGINYAVSTGARILLASISSRLHSPSIDAALANAEAHGVVVITIAGNSGRTVGPTWTPDQDYPLGSTSATAIVVGGWYEDQGIYSRWADSTPSSYVDILADVTALNAGCWYDYLHADVSPCNVTDYNGAPAIIGTQGTSIAAPRVAEAVARMLQVSPWLTTTQVRSILAQSATPIPNCGPGCGAGRLNADAAVAMAANVPNPCP